MSHAPATLPRAWLIVCLLWVVALLNYLDRIMLTTMRTSLVEAIPMSEAQYGLLTSVFLWVYAVLSPFAGFLADRFNRRRLILTSLFVWSLLTWLTGHTKTFEQLLTVRALMGVSEAAYLPAALALIADYHRGPTRSLATGLHMTGLSVGSALGGLGGWLAEKHGWSAAFDLFGLFGIVYAGVLAVVIRDAPAAETAPAVPADPVRLEEALASLFRSRSFLLLCAYWGFFGLAGWAVTHWMPTYFKEHFHLSQTEAGLTATSVIFTPAIFGKLIGGAWADYWSRSEIRARVLVPAIGMFVAAPATFFVVHAPALAFAIAGLSIFGAMRGFSDTNLMPILCQVADARYRATGYGVLNFFSCAADGAAIYAGGALRDAHVSVSVLFLSAAAGLFLCGVLLLFVKPRPTAKALEL